MKTALLSSLLLLSALAPAQDRLAAGSTLGSTGLICVPWSCTPAPLAAARNTSLQLSAQGSMSAPRVLLISLQPAQCVTLPGFGGALIVQPPMIAPPLPLTWGRMYVNQLPGQPSCGGWIGFGGISLPANLPSGLVFTLQTLSAGVPQPGRYPWNFSNAVEVTLL